MRIWTSLKAAGVAVDTPRHTLGIGTYGDVFYYEGSRGIAIKEFKDLDGIIDACVWREIEFYHYAEEEKLTWAPRLVGVIVNHQTGKVCLLMERHGKCLHNLISLGKLSKEAKKSISIQMINLLYGVSHCYHLVHLDLKPANLLWDGKTLKLIDWGFCRDETMRQGRFLKSGHVAPPLHTPKVQTSNYRAPEIILAGSKAPRGAPQELWSLGLCLLHLWMGRCLGSPGDKDRVFLSLWFSLFGPMDRYEKVGNDTGLYAGWRAFCKRFDGITFDPPNLGDEVFPGFLQDWVVGRLLVTNPSHRATWEEIEAHPVIGACLEKPPFFKDPLLCLAEWVPGTGFDQANLTSRHWSILLGWLWEAALVTGMDLSTFFLGATIIFHYNLKDGAIRKNHFQKLGIASLSLASLWCDKWGLSSKDAAYYCDKAYTQSEIEEMASNILKVVPPILDLWRRSPWYLSLLNLSDENRILLIYTMARDLIANPRHFVVNPLEVAKSHLALVASGFDREVDLPYQPSDWRPASMREKMEKAIEPTDAAYRAYFGDSNGE